MRFPVGAEGRYITIQTIQYLVTKVSVFDSRFLVMSAGAGIRRQRSGPRPSTPACAKLARE
jgi:hypothetical protein